MLDDAVKPAIKNTERVVRRKIDLQLAENLHKNPLAGRLLAGRGLQHVDEVLLQTSQLPKPDQLADFSTAVNLLAVSVQKQHSIVVIGDYDADGATSTALAVHVLRKSGAQVSYLVPNRFEFGYGLSPEVVAVALQEKPDLILTTDNGVASNEGVLKAKEAGVTVVVTDHHLPPEVLPEADAIVNPNRKDCNFPSKNICGVGVIFYVMAGLCRSLQSAGWYEQQNLTMPHMPAYLDLVALGTVADVVPLDRTNRVLVDQGVRRIRADETRAGIRALFRVAGRQQPVCMTQDLGFFIAPRLNAAGRLADMTTGIECLLADDTNVALDLATELNTINTQRRSIQSGMNEEAERQVGELISQYDGNPPSAISLYHPDWHEGVIGIVAGRIKERCHRPVFAFAKSADGTLKGSGRSIDGVHIRDILMDMVAVRPDLLKKFGGHAMAAGVTLNGITPNDVSQSGVSQNDEMADNNFDAFSQLFNERVAIKLDGVPPAREWLTDGELDDGELCLENAELIRYLQPWGQMFPAPLFDDVFQIESSRILRNAHSRLVLRRCKGRRKLAAIAFNRVVETDNSQTWRIVYRLDVNHYRESKSLQLLVEHLEPI